jgi:MFS family permease
MAIGADGRIIRRRVRIFTPVNTNNPPENTGFFIGLFSVLFISVIFILIFLLIGWLGGWFFDLKWWNYRNFFIAGFLINLLIFPIYISGVLEGLASSNFSRYRFYAFLYGAFAIAILISLNAWSKPDFNYWNYLWAAGYGLYSRWLATRMSH